MAEMSRGQAPLTTIASKFLAKAPWICLAIYVATLAYTLYAISSSAVEPTRISENALLPGLVEEGFDAPHKVVQFAERLRKGLKNGKRLRDLIEAELRALRIESHRQGFKWTGPILSDNGVNATVGENIYGIVRAYRTSPVESILVAVKMKSSHIDSLAIALSLAWQSARQIYWARDVIFLFVDGEKLATEAWMSAYHSYQHSYIEADELETHAGFIIGAYAIDVIGSNFPAINVQFGMINGKLPNLDLVNLFILLAEKNGSPVTIYQLNHTPGTRRGGDYSYLSALRILYKSLFQQGFIEYEGLHSIMGSYGVNAVTLHARQKTSSPSSGESSVGTMEVVRIGEGGLRSLNNILEKLHQSYFLYLLPHPHKFISVAFYMPVIGGLAVPILLLGIREWLGIGSMGTQPTADPPAFYIIRLHAVSTLCYFIHRYLLIHYSSLVASPLLVVLLGIGWLTLLPICSRSEIKTADDHRFLRFFTAFEFVLFTAALGLLNFPLALSLAVLFTPLTFFTLAISGRNRAATKLAGFLCLNPVTIAFITAAIVGSPYNEGAAVIKAMEPVTSLLPLVVSIWQRLRQYLTQIVLNHFAHNSWLYPIITIVFFNGYQLLTGALLYRQSPMLEDDLKHEQSDEEKKEN